MATEILRPNAAGDETSISNQYPNSTLHYDKVDEASPDEGATYLFEMYGSYSRDLYNLPASSGSGTINFIKIYIRCRSDGSKAYAKPSLKSDSTVTDGSEIQTNTTWTTYSQQWSTNPADGQPWEWADIDALQIGISLKAYYQSWCTQVYVEVDYEPATILYPSSIPSAEAFGTAQLNLKVALSSISSAEAFGTARLNLNIASSGIVSAEAFGTPIVISGLTIYPTGITSAEAFGVPIIAGPLLVTGIPSAEAFGTPEVTPGGVSVVPLGISSEELFGLPKLNLFVTPSGIVTSEAFGTAKLSLKLILSGIASAEAFGTPTVNMILVIRPSGIASAEQFGIPIIIVILAGGDGMSSPTTKGQVSIPQRQVSIPSKEVSI